MGVQLRFVSRQWRLNQGRQSGPMVRPVADPPTRSSSITRFLTEFAPIADQLSAVLKFFAPATYTTMAPVLNYIPRERRSVLCHMCSWTH